jgi:fatty acid desaturase
MRTNRHGQAALAIEWPTLALIGATYGAFAWATTAGYALSPILGIMLTGIAIAQFSSLQHEALHGHPFGAAWLNEALVFPALSVTVPYGRFRDTHLAHHHDPHLTDPYDDPESNYLDPVAWDRLPAWRRHLHRANNSLLGRMVIGPALGNALWLVSEARLLWAGNGRARRDWGLHLVGLVLLALWIVPAQMPVWAYGLAAYLGHALLKIRTFLEHRAHTLARARTVIVEDRGPLSILFLNNNFHAVHHCHPQVAWYQLPRLYARQRAQFQKRTEGYVYRSYAEIFRLYLLRAKDPVPHPLMGQGKQAMHHAATATGPVHGEASTSR